MILVMTMMIKVIAVDDESIKPRTQATLKRNPNCRLKGPDTYRNGNYHRVDADNNDNNDDTFFIFNDTLTWCASYTPIAHAATQKLPPFDAERHQVRHQQAIKYASANCIHTKPPLPPT